MYLRVKIWIFSVIAYHVPLKPITLWRRHGRGVSKLDEIMKEASH